MRALAPLLLLPLAPLIACGEDPVVAVDAGPGRDAATSADGADGSAVTSGDAAPAGDDAGPADSAPDPSDPLFDRGRLLRVELELSPADWDALRAETRTLESTLARPECLDTPFASPFHYYPARLRIDGADYPQVGLRKKGFLGSLSEAKPSLKIKLDEYTAGLEHLGLSKLVFNNGQQDPTLIKPCIGLDVMRAAGVPAPRCGFAEVVVNGESLGPYVQVEDVGRRFVKRRFGPQVGHLYEGTISDFRDGWTGTFEQELDEDVPYDRAELEAMRAALEAPDDQLLAALDPLLDLEAYLRFWAAEVLIEHWDGYAGNTNNFFLYGRPDGRLEMIPWGVDGILGTRPQPPLSVYATGLLARRLYFHPPARARYLDALRAQVERWDADALVQQIDRASRLIAPAVPMVQRAVVDDSTEALRAYVRGRQAAMLAELDAGGGEWTEPLRDRLCFELSSTVVTLETRFGSYPAPNIFAAGTGTFTATIAGSAVRGLMVGGAAGYGNSPDDMDDVVLAIAATLPDGSIPIFYAAIEPSRFTTGAVLPFDGVAVRGALLRIPRPGAAIELVAGVWTGQIVVRQGDITAGAPVEVEIGAMLLANRP